jgi:hypothetical protein
LMTWMSMELIGSMDVSPIHNFHGIFWRRNKIINHTLYILRPFGMIEKHFLVVAEQWDWDVLSLISYVFLWLWKWKIQLGAWFSVHTWPIHKSPKPLLLYYHNSLDTSNEWFWMHVLLLTVFCPCCTGCGKFSLWHPIFQPQFTWPNHKLQRGVNNPKKWSGLLPCWITSVYNWLDNDLHLHLLLEIESRFAYILLDAIWVVAMLCCDYRWQWAIISVPLSWIYEYGLQRPA